MAPNRAAALVRTRVEPKTFFANERTFLQWLQISVLVMMIAFALLRCGDWHLLLAWQLATMKKLRGWWLIAQWFARLWYIERMLDSQWMFARHPALQVTHIGMPTGAAPAACPFPAARW